MTTTPAPLVSLRPTHRRALRVLSALSLGAALGGWYAFAWQPVGQVALVLGMGGAWVLGSLSTRTVSLGMRQGLVWTGFGSVCIHRGKNPAPEKASWVVDDVLTGKSQRVDAHWLTPAQRAVIASWNAPVNPD